MKNSTYVVFGGVASVILAVGLSAVLMEGKRSSGAALSSKEGSEIAAQQHGYPPEALGRERAGSIESDYAVDAGDMLESTAVADPVIKAPKLTPEEVQGLVRMREEEKLARDVYLTLGNVWGTRIFSNISSSEQTHTDAVRALLVRYGIKDPVTDDSVGIFTSTSMQELYDTLVAKGKASLTAALEVGATVEDLDISDLNALKESTDKEDILAVYNDLQRGSRNHMRAFVRNLTANGGVYTPQYISASDYEAIISGTQERGRH